MNNFKILIAFFCLKNLYHCGAVKVVCLNLVPCCAVSSGKHLQRRPGGGDENTADKMYPR